VSSLVCIMPEREFFSLRYAVPGFTFILIVAVFNHRLLLATLETDFRSAFALIFSLLSGPATGFLISQFWWWRFQLNSGLLGIPEFNRAFRAFAEKYNSRKKSLEDYEKDEHPQLLAALDYVSHLETKSMLLILAERKWDMYHILSSTYYTLWIASVVGLVCRFCYEHYVLKPTYDISLQSLIMSLSNNLESIILTLTLVVMIIWILLFRTTRKWILKQLVALAVARIRSSKVSRHELMNAFPNLFSVASDK